MALTLGLWYMGSIWGYWSGLGWPPVPMNPRGSCHPHGYTAIYTTAEVTTGLQQIYYHRQYGHIINSDDTLHLTLKRRGGCCCRRSLSLPHSERAPSERASFRSHPVQLLLSCQSCARGCLSAKKKMEMGKKADSTPLMHCHFNSICEQCYRGKLR